MKGKKCPECGKSPCACKGKKSKPMMKGGKLQSKAKAKAKGRKPTKEYGAFSGDRD